jgi:hypothetical protein|tara:strand:- start:210 stop:872 length:663 start_codon:yes stop_codon:yes gene_type:complete
MYISHKHKIVFIRIPKTACSSITEFLIKNIADPEAIHSGVDDSKIKSTLVSKAPIRKLVMANKYVHYTLQDIVDDGFIKAEDLSTYKIYAVIRNPVDRQKSMYWFRKKWQKVPPGSLQDYKNITIGNCEMKLSPTTGEEQVSFMKYNNKSYGTFWLFENIDKELNNLMSSLGLNIKHDLPNHKSGNRKKDEFEFDKEVLNSLRAHYNNDFAMYKDLRIKQ